MTQHLRRSRVTKALTDAGLVASFPDAEARLDAVDACIVLGDEQAFTRAGQAAVLTAVATAFKCFGRITLAMSAPAAPLLLDVPLGATLAEAVATLGARVMADAPLGATHRIIIGGHLSGCGWEVACWWDRWLSGLRIEDAACGDSRLGLAGVFAGALAVRQIFASVLVGPTFIPRDTTLSLWEPWTEAPTDPGPTRFTAPNALWLVGLGHLGQGFVWNLLTLPYRGPRQAVLQDDQRIGVENEPTSLLVVEAGEHRRKVRVAAGWLDAAGWDTRLIERRHQGDIQPTNDDPPLLLCGLDDVRPRRILAGLGFDYMIDAGIGHGPGDFEGLQIRTIPKGVPTEKLWNAPSPPRVVDDLLGKAAYQALTAQAQGCGAYTLADGSVAVPFVGAATGALTIAQAIRLASMQPAGALIQIGLAAPEMQIDGGLRPAPEMSFGGEPMDLDATPGPSAG
jgi:hypothetical protein